VLSGPKSAIAQIQKLKGQALTESICNAVLAAWEGMPKLKEQRDNPFAAVLLYEWYVPSADIASRDIARIFLAQIDRRRRLLALRKEGEELNTRAQVEMEGAIDGYIRLDTYIGNVTPEPFIESLPEWLFHDPDISQILWAYFDVARSYLDDALDLTCKLIRHGVPLFEERDGLCVQVPFSDSDYIYLSKKSEYGETCSGALNPPGRIPDWAEKYFFKLEHIEAHRSFFGGQPVAGDALLKAARPAFRKSIGYEHSSEIEAYRPKSVSELHSRSAHKRWEPLRSVRTKAVELYESTQWRSRAEAVRKLKPKVLALAKEAGNPLSEDNAAVTIGSWFKEAEHKRQS
jgi:hypothetical protein